MIECSGISTESSKFVVVMITSQRQRRSSVGGVTRSWDRPGYRFSPDGVPAIPASEFGNPATYERELATMLRPGHGLMYLGHDLMLPGKGHRVADGDPRVVLTRDDDGAVRALANMCTHSLRPLLESNDFVDKSCITCPFHQWSFRRDGSLIGARDMTFGEGGSAEVEALKAELALPTFEVLTWAGLHFAINPQRRAEYELDFARLNEDFATRGLSDHLNFDDWVVYATEDTPFNADWKTFLEVFGDCYHVPPYHPGLASFSDCETLEWTFGPNYNSQFLDLHPTRGAASEKYAGWISGLEQYHERRGETMGTFAVAWLGMYPNIMIELYAGMRVFSVIIPTGPSTHINRSHYLVPADMETLVPGLPATMKAAFDETGVEDQVLVESRHTGAKTAQSLGINIESYRPNLTGPAPEAGTAHFYDWYYRELREQTSGVAPPH